MSPEMFSGGLGLFLAVLIFVVAILWFFLPFSIFGIKDKLDVLIAEARKTNSELAKITAELAASRSEQASLRSSNPSPHDS